MCNGHIRPRTLHNRHPYAQRMVPQLSHTRIARLLHCSAASPSLPHSSPTSLTNPLRVHVGEVEVAAVLPAAATTCDPRRPWIRAPALAPLAIFFVLLLSLFSWTSRGCNRSQHSIRFLQLTLCKRRGRATIGSVVVGVVRGDYLESFWFAF